MLGPEQPKEIHSLGVGAMDGLKGTGVYKSMETAGKYVPDIQEEPHYYRLGYFLTNRSKWIITTAAALRVI